jgi:aspartate/methionine/tyrosine aminotransferase
VKFARRMDNLGTEGAFEVLARARMLEADGKSVIHLEIGEPDFPTPDNIIEAAYGAMREDYTHYTPAGGILEVREAVADFLNRRLGTDVQPLEVVMVPGSKNVLLFTLLSCIEPGDEVILPDPGYPVYESLVRFIEAKPVPIRLREDRGFRMDLDELASLVTDRTRLLIVNTPQNPTGGVLTRADVEFIARLAIERDLLVLADEIYSQIIYGDFQHTSLLSLPGMRERTVLLDGLSKAYAMCGWRLGYGVAPRELAARMETLMINSSSCAAAFTQMAAIEAFNSPESDRAVERMVGEFQRRRDLMVDGLNRIPGFRCVRPDGAFYAFPNVEGTGIDEKELADRLLQEAGVAVLPGTAFGSAGKGYLRLAYTQSDAAIGEALRRMEAFLRQNSEGGRP